jgi:hypothetical protein
MTRQTIATTHKNSLAIAQHLAIAMVQHVHHWHNLRRLREPLLVFLRYQRPQLIHVDRRVPLRVPRQMETAHTDLTEVTRMVFIEICSE